MDSQIEQIAILTGTTPKMALVDSSYRGVQASAGTRLLVSHTRRLPKNLKKLLKRRQVVEPMIGRALQVGLVCKQHVLELSARPRVKFGRPQQISARACPPGSTTLCRLVAERESATGRAPRQ